MFRKRTTANTKTRLRGFEGLETRELMAADLLGAHDSPAPMDELCTIDAVPAAEDGQDTNRFEYTFYGRYSTA